MAYSDAHSQTLTINHQNLTGTIWEHRNWFIIFSEKKPQRKMLQIIQQWVLECVCGFTWSLLFTSLTRINPFSYLLLASVLRHSWNRFALSLNLKWNVMMMICACTVCASESTQHDEMVWRYECESQWRSCHSIMFLFDSSHLWVLRVFLYFILVDGKVNTRLPHASSSRYQQPIELSVEFLASKLYRLVMGMDAFSVVMDNQSLNTELTAA